MGWPFHSHFGVSTWRSLIAGPKGWHYFQGEWSKIKALHSEPRARCRRGIRQFDGSRLFILKFITNTLGSSVPIVRSSALKLCALVRTSAPPPSASLCASAIGCTRSGASRDLFRSQSPSSLHFSPLCRALFSSLSAHTHTHFSTCTDIHLATHHLTPPCRRSTTLCTPLHPTIFFFILSFSLTIFPFSPFLL
jgi:hypothetical protein